MTKANQHSLVKTPVCNRKSPGCHDHQTDPNEFDNLAYSKKCSEIVNEFRQELVSRVSRVSIQDIEKSPKGYTVKNNKVHNDSFIPIEDLKLDE